MFTYVAFTNSAIGIIALLFGGVGMIAQLFGIQWLIGLLVILGFAGGALCFLLPEVDGN